VPIFIVVDEEIDAIKLDGTNCLIGVSCQIVAAGRLSRIPKKEKSPSQLLPIATGSKDAM
jgi:hypothetical protein